MFYICIDYIHHMIDYTGTLSLFDDLSGEFELPHLAEGPYDQAFDELALLGFPLCSPFDLLAETERLTGSRYVVAEQLGLKVGTMVEILGYYVCRKHVRTSKGDLMYFGTFIDKEGAFFDTVHFPNFVALSPFTGKGIYHIEGCVAIDFGFPSVEVTRMERLPFRQDDRF